MVDVVVVVDDVVVVVVVVLFPSYKKSPSQGKRLQYRLRGELERKEGIDSKHPTKFFNLPVVLLLFISRFALVR